MRARVRSSHMPASGCACSCQAWSPTRSSSSKSSPIGAPEQPVIVERLRRTEHDVAVDVVLEVLECLVAHAHRAHAGDNPATW